MLKEILDKTAERAGKDLTNQPEVEAELRLTLADVYYDLGLFKQSEQMAREVVRLGRSRLGGEPHTVARGLVILGRALRNLRLQEAETVTREALAVCRQVYGKEDLAVALPLKTLALIFWQEGNMLSPEPLLREALAIERKFLGNENEDVADTMSILAGVLRSQNRLTEAETMFREGLGIRRKLHGQQHPYVALTLINYSHVLRYQGKLAEAEALLREALTMQRKMLGNEHASVASSLNFLANVLEMQGRLAEAEPLLLEAAAIRRKALGYEHPNLPMGLNHLGRVQYGRGEFSAAETTLREAVAIMKKMKGSRDWHSRRSSSWGRSCKRRADWMRLSPLTARRLTGSTDAYAALAHMYHRGEGVARNPTEATEWNRRIIEEYRKRAEGGGS